MSSRRSPRSPKPTRAEKAQRLKLKAQGKDQTGFKDQAVTIQLSRFRWTTEIRGTQGCGAPTNAERDRSPVAAASSEPGRLEILAPSRVRGRAVPVPEGRRRRLAGGKSAAADAAPGKRAEWLGAPAGHRRKWSAMLDDHWGSDRPEATSGGGEAAGRPTPKISSMPRWGMPCSARQQPGAAPAGAGLPPANFLLGPSGTKSQASATILR